MRRLPNSLPYALSLSLPLLLAGCAGGARPAAGPPGAPAVAPGTLPAVRVDHLEERGLLLLLVDRQTYEPLVVRRSLAGPPDLREELAVALGRAGDPRGIDPLAGLLVDDDAPVRRAAAFALGELGEGLPAAHDALRRRAARDLLRATRDPDRAVGRLAVEALGKLGVTVGQVAAALAEEAPRPGPPGSAVEAALEEGERLARLLPSLWRFPDRESVPLALAGMRAGLGRDDPELREAAAYALTREPRPGALDRERRLEALGAIRRLVVEGESPRIRAWGARALGLVGGTGDLALLLPLLDAPEEDPVIQALIAGRALVADGRAAPADAWREPLAELLADPRPGVRRAAIDTAGTWLLDPVLSERLAAAAAGGRRDGGPGAAERAEALLALATGGDPRAEELAARAAGDREPRVRAGAAEAAGVLALPGLLDRLAGDPEPVVRQAALAARLALAGVLGERGAPAVVAAGALADPDPGVRTVVLGWLAKRPVVPMTVLAEAVERSLYSPVVEERLAAVEAVAARGGGPAAPDRGAAAAEAERPAAVALLEYLATEAGYPTRLRAAAALEELGRTRPAVGPVVPPGERGLAVEAYRRIVLETRRPRAVEMVTERGTVRIRLACPRAPLTCVNFLRLAEQGFYDGLGFHRAVPGFVVQGGDPRGDGYGGPGYTIRDEIGRLRYGEGVVGMALAGPDTGGSQFFVTLSAQPHLDGGYTAFGEVVEGMEVLGRIVPGDRIESIREVVER